MKQGKYGWYCYSMAVYSYCLLEAFSYRLNFSFSKDVTFTILLETWKKLHLHSKVFFCYLGVSKDQSIRGQSSTFNFAHTLSIGKR